MTAGSALWQRRSARRDSVRVEDRRPSADATELCLTPALEALEFAAPRGSEKNLLQLSGRPEDAVPASHCRVEVKCWPRPLRIDCALAAAESSVSDPFATSECRDVSERFDILQSLGQGSVAVVYKARQRSSDSEVALKLLRTNDEEMLSAARHEYDLLSSIEHPNIIHALDFFTFPRGVVLVLEYFHGRSLEAAVLESPAGHLQENDARGLFAALMQAVEHLHRSGVLHRDVKAANVLVGEGLKDLKLADFNTARRWLDGALTLTGTADYLPPEVLRGEPHTAASDIWASGLCLYYALAGQLPLQRGGFRSNGDFASAIVARRGARFEGRRWGHVSEMCKEALRWCLPMDPLERPSAVEVLESPWLCGASAHAC